MKTTRSLSRPASKSATKALVSSPSLTRRELAVLRRGRERLEAEPRVDETSARTSVAPRRMASP